MNIKNYLQKKWYIIAYLVGPLLLLLGIIINISENNSLAGLKETTGKVLFTDISMSSGRKTTNYSPVVKYSYEVNGKKFENSRIGLARFTYSSTEAAGEVVAKYPLNKNIPVFYLPENPQTAYLDIKEAGNGEMVIFLSILEMLFFTPIIWLIRRQHPVPH